MSKTEPARFDLFVSYCQRDPDGSFVRDVLIPRLDQAGLRVFVDYREFQLGATLVQEMERGVAESRRTLAIASPVYLSSSWTEFEGVLAQHLGIEVKQVRLIVAKLQPCDLPLRLRSFLGLDWTTPALFERELPRLIEVLRR
jgi:hypothetical protein